MHDEWLNAILKIFAILNRPIIKSIQCNYMQSQLFQFIHVVSYDLNSLVIHILFVSYVAIVCL